jgi:hypothetical protein
MAFRRARICIAALVARDRRILAGHAAGATTPEFALAEEIDPAVVLRAAGITPRQIRKPIAAGPSDRLTDHAWLAAEYATKSGAQIAP